MSTSTLSHGYTHLYAFATGKEAKQQTKEWIDNTAATLDWAISQYRHLADQTDDLKRALVLIDSTIEAVARTKTKEWSPHVEPLRSARRHLLERQHELLPALAEAANTVTELQDEKDAAVAHMVKLRETDRIPCPTCGTAHAVSAPA